ncbi:glycoside hydrolase family 28 protein [Uliginosibacterium sp. 31-12]|uniref:glycoside hydrolase family 28 protein n=1 Tax=Uliginosibacterium sp. 31-12 TaxID=3062781 RepID=UPI0026E2A830|nr:glycoside hydrolase family 28 protein [Uliginosibacterium sp. 31-12]MDO6387543.1 glycoside hydrolase family 28 protein [Uliginosibacterium sp. 31-12]
MKNKGMPAGAAALICALVLGACGGGGSDAGGSSAGTNSGAAGASSGAAVSSASSSAAASGASSQSASSAASVAASSAAVSSGASGENLSLQVPPLAYDDSSLTLVWKKPADYSALADFNVYMNGSKLGSAAANNTLNSPAKPYIDQFYAADTAGFHVKVLFHNFKVTGLAPDTAYTFTVRAVDAAGKESADSQPLTVRTAPAYTRIYDVSKLGAMGDGTTLNTSVIQDAIDTCAAGSSSAYGCKVLIPADAASGKIFLTGALFLKSNMTLEIAEGATLKGSADSADYPLAKGYQLYSYFTNSTDDRRPPSLLNALNPAHMNGTAALVDHNGYDETRGVFQNIRITGKGTLDGNGWTRSATDTTDELGKGLANFAGGSASKVASLGILAKSQLAATGATVGSTAHDNYYSNRRSSLATFRGVRNIYLGELKLTNPAYHGVMFLESENMVFANTVTQTFDINNADGVEFGNSDNAFVFNNFVDSGDDNINFAAGQGKNYEGVTSQQNAWIFNNYLREGHGGVVAGSHTGAWIQDILAEDNVMFLTDNGLRMKSTPATGGGARRVVFRDNAMRNVGTKNSVTISGRTLSNNTNGNPFIFTLAYSAGSNVFDKASASAQFRDITIRNVTVDNVSTSSGGAMIKVDGYDGTDATLGYAETFQENILFDTVKITNALPMSISRLKDSRFTNVTITNWGTATTPWAIANSSGLTYSGVTPAVP